MDSGVPTQEAGPSEGTQPSSSFLRESSTHLLRLVKEEELTRELRTLKAAIVKAEEDEPRLRHLRGLTRRRGPPVTPGAPESRPKPSRNRSRSSQTPAEKEHRDKLWKLRGKVNSLRQRRETGKATSEGMVKEILLGEKDLDLSLLTEEDQRICFK